MAELPRSQASGRDFYNGISLSWTMLTWENWSQRMYYVRWEQLSAQWNDILAQEQGQ